MSDTGVIDVTVAAVERMGRVLCFDLRAVSGQLPACRAGAHVDLHLGDGLIRQYSLCGDPADRERYRLAVLLEPASRGGSRRVHEIVSPGAILQARQPRNLFPLAVGASRSVLVGGGIGVTPLIAMAYELHAAGAPFTLHYIARDPVFADLLFRTPFAGAVRIHDRSDAASPRFEPAAVLSAAVADGAAVASLHVYSCGPNSLMDAVDAAAKAIGLPDDNVHREAFSALPVAGGTGFEVLAAKSSVRVSVGENETIAAALARVGVKVAVSCEQGICGTCVVDLLEGMPDHRDEYLTEEERSEQIALCCSRARSPLLVVDL
ncbi:PDR/VanB family oxidoreductase [Gluconacetobacter azotocaptans]|uniref:PDR/VanB family oxidoreductase n=1 Tax=Gluconacetobacter azotocaptans TaxID=142834 RepID=UPI001F04F592|nr:PDR/VanB family oxidoreductase [Gluconacetobacter azotocaptans]